MEPMKFVCDRRAFLKTGGVGLTLLAQGPFAACGAESSSKIFSFPKCSILPLPGHQVAFEISGQERVRWHFGPQYPRPFFFPFQGPSGVSLTRMGHPGAPNHDHHRSIWFAHHDVDGIDFWSDNSRARIRQKQWMCYVDGERDCKAAFRLGWYADGNSQEILEQTVIAMLRPARDGETFLELQSSFRPVGETVPLGKTNFGFLAVRVAKSISAHFGGGKITDSEGRSGEPAIFGNRAKWMDYSGPVRDGGWEGITYFDHPDNPRFPTHWHVREDGWMGASFCMEEGMTISSRNPLRLRYLLHAHGGKLDPEKASRVFVEFSRSPEYEAVPSDTRHHQFELQIKD